ncbi:hypothetical protein N7465_010242 [Penicillium sp. CMV-2018d]|nr:hypothetical protein N7465_010242 [Penicillium sp. CMV-2018d]
MPRVPDDLWSFTSRQFSSVNIHSREDRQACATGPQHNERIFPKRALSPGCSDLLVRGLGVHHPTDFNGLLIRGRSLPPAADETAVETDVQNRIEGGSAVARPFSSWSSYWTSLASNTLASSPNMGSSPERIHDAFGAAAFLDVDAWTQGSIRGIADGSDA